MINLDGRSIILHLRKIFNHHVVIIHATIWNILIYLVWTPNIHNLYPKKMVCVWIIHTQLQNFWMPLQTYLYIHTIGPLTNSIRSILLMWGSLIKFESKKFKLFWMQKLKFFNWKNTKEEFHVGLWDKEEKYFKLVFSYNCNFKIVY